MQMTGYAGTQSAPYRPEALRDAQPSVPRLTNLVNAANVCADSCSGVAGAIEAALDRLTGGEPRVEGNISNGLKQAAPPSVADRLEQHTHDLDRVLTRLNRIAERLEGLV